MTWGSLVDFSQKDIVIQVGADPAITGPEAGKHEGIIFSPERIEAGDHTTANYLHREFGLANVALEVNVLLRTEQGPGEMRDTLSRLIGEDIESSLFVGGYIRPMNLTPEQLAKLKAILASSDDDVKTALAKSREKEMFE